jgi:hypothetical protein
MVYAVAALTLLGLIIWAASRRTNRLNQTTRLTFPMWLHLYNRAEAIEKEGMATVFVNQTLHLSTEMAAISRSTNAELVADLKNTDRVRLVEEWLEVGLPSVIEVVGRENIANCEAREVGMFVLVCLQGVNPTGNLKRFLAQLR